MKALLRIGIIFIAVVAAVVVGFLGVMGQHALIGLLCTPALAVCAVYAGEAAGDLEWQGRLLWIRLRHRVHRWRRRLAQLAGGSTALARHPYREAGAQVRLQRLRDFEGIDTAVIRFAAAGRAFGLRVR